jgi:hypothetical protein
VVEHFRLRGDAGEACSACLGQIARDLLGAVGSFEDEERFLHFDVVANLGEGAQRMKRETARGRKNAAVDATADMKGRELFARLDLLPD